MKRTLLPFLFAPFALFPSGCGTQETDVHDEPAGAYAAVEVAALDLAGIKAHLLTLKAEIERATEQADFGQMHYLEVALTATLDALGTELPEDVKASADPLIAEIRPMAIKLHVAGHDRNASISRKVGAALSKQIDELTQLIP